MADYIPPKTIVRTPDGRVAEVVRYTHGPMGRMAICRFPGRPGGGTITVLPRRLQVIRRPMR